MVDGRRSRLATVAVLACVVCLGCAGSGQELPADRPNILLIVVDTLRADRVHPPDGAISMTPAIRRRIAARGAVFERAYAPAPWTLPSMLGVMTGRHPGEQIPADLSHVRLPENAPAMAEVLAEHGYRTAGFTANPTLHEGNGYARGFETFYSPPPDGESALLHAEDDLQPRVLRWLRHRSGERPFFLWVQYLDPHDPYAAPSGEGLIGRSGSDVTRDGPAARVIDGAGKSYLLTGGDVHGLHTGELRLEDARGIEVLRALYDAEVRYVDGVVDRLLDAVGEKTLKRTVVVLTSDHGEELHDRGGWKHGQTLYDEQVRVPLLVRWDGAIPTDLRVREPVSLLDLLPTLAALVGAEAPSTDGADLSPSLVDGAPVPERPVFTRGLSRGPVRVATIVGADKLVLFDRAARFRPRDAMDAHAWRLDLERLRRVELYDLEADPGELRDLSGRAPARVRSLQAFIHALLDEQLPGLRIAAAGAPPGSRLRVAVEFDRPVLEWDSYFLDAGSAVRVDGETVELELEGGAVTTGIRLPLAEPGLSIESVRAMLDGRPLEAAAIRVGESPYLGAPVPPARLLGSAWAPVPGAPVLQIWFPRGPDVAPGLPDEEQLRRLRALGYVQ